MPANSYNRILVGGFTEWLRRLLNLSDEGVTVLAPELSAVIGLTNRLEWPALLGERLCAGFVTVSAGGAGFISAARLGNPAGSNILCIVEYMIPRANQDLQVRVTGSGASLGTDQNTAAFRDTRWGVGSATVRPQCKITTKNGDATTTGFQFASCVSPTGSYRPYPLNLVIGPGQGFEVNASVANTGLTIDLIVWREKFATTRELSVV